MVFNCPKRRLTNAKDAMKIHNLKPLQALSALSREGTFLGAAQVLNLTSPAVHTQLKNLEKNLQTQLIIRPASGPMKLTEAGKILVAATERINSELAKSLCDIDAVRQAKRGHIRLGVVSTGKYFAPSLVAILKQKHPDIKIMLEVGNREQIVSLLETQAIHLAIMGRPPRSPPVNSIVIGPHPHILIASPNHPLAEMSAIPRELLLGETIIAREEGSGSRLLMARYLDEIGDGQPYNLTVMGSNETIKQAVMAGLGIAILSKHTVVEELRCNRLVSLNLDGLPVQRHWYLLDPSNIPISPVAQVIRNEIAGMKGTFLP